jgi:hypothetical protein
MLLVSDVFDDVKRLMSNLCPDDAAILNRISDATELLCNKADVDPLIGCVDIATSGGKAVTLPREVDTILALNISGVPSFPRNRWAEFHLNGFGTDDSDKASYFWDDKGDYPLFSDPAVPCRFSAITTNEDDVAAGEIWVYGYDTEDRRVMTEVGGSMRDGYRVPLTANFEAPDEEAPLFKRVTEVRKTSSKGFFMLYGTPEGGEPALHGEYEPTETLPRYRRIQLSMSACWVRVQYRRKVFRIVHQTDRIPVHSRYALMLMCKALQKYDDDKIDEAEKYEKKAVQWLIEKQQSTNPPSSPTIQVSETTSLVDRHDRMS